MIEEGDRPLPKLIATTPTGANRGTAWVIKRDTTTIWVLTNRHVITDNRNQPSPTIEAEYFSDPPRRPNPPPPARPTPPPHRPNHPLDLALLRIDNAPADIQPLPISTTSIPRSTPITIIGHPNFGLPWSVETGIISNRSSDRLQISQVTIAVGNSGGPVLNANNQVIGIVVETITPSDLAGTPGSSGFGLAYPMSHLTDILTEWDMLP